MTVRGVVLLVLFLAEYSTTICHAQVNTEAMRFNTDLPGFTISGNLSGEYVEGNSDYITYSGQLRLDYRKEKNHAFYIANFDRGETNKKLYINSGFMHMRSVRQTNSRIKTEMFAQLEYNDFLHIEQRRLAGGGLRINFLKYKDVLDFNMGLAAMWENEEYVDPEWDDASGTWTIFPTEDKDLIRSTNYLTGKWYINEHVTFNLTTYYQPDISNFDDFRLLMDTGLRILFSDIFYFTTIIHYRHDSEPPTGLEDYDLSMTNGIGFAFN